MVGDENVGARYRAFISYSHRDARIGRRLHRALEGYALPRRLVGQPGARGPTPARLAPIFRDREELSAAHDLSAEVRAALAASDSLVVVCSPAAAASPWVGREIELFRSLHPDRPILAALAEGEPALAFPPVLTAGPDGPIEPLAADFRPHRDGPRLGLLKLVAGILGIGLDQLVQRDAQRRVRRVMAVTAVALSATVAMAATTILAVRARAEADRQRAEAEGLVEFMLTDLRTRLKGVGRLDVMDAVNQRALKYYASQDLDRLPTDSLERRAALLRAMGEDDEARGDMSAAANKFEEARRTTAALLADEPNDPKRIYAQAQSEFWAATVDYKAGRPKAARAGFLAYKRQADRLVAISPGNPTYLKEAAYAEGDLCTAVLKPPQDPTEALRACKSSLDHMQAAAVRQGGGESLAEDIETRHGWLADAYKANGDNAHALEHRMAQRRILDRLMAYDPKNMKLTADWVGMQRGFAGLEYRSGRKGAALERLMRAREVTLEMVDHDPANVDWQSLRAKVDDDITKTRLAIGKANT